MTSLEALALDSSFYAEYDHDVGAWGVFGDESGFCYETPASREEAERIALEMTIRYGLTG